MILLQTHVGKYLVNCFHLYYALTSFIQGSESVASAYTSRVDNYNISFEQLLSSSFDSISKSKCCCDVTRNFN
jgi:hypothetical protein